MELWLTPMREECYQSPRFAHWWQGWRWRLGSLVHTEDVVDYVDDGVGYKDVPIVVGQRRRFCGWRQLARPTVTKKRLVPVAERQQAKIVDGAIRAVFDVDTECTVTELWITDGDGMRSKRHPVRPIELAKYDHLDIMVPWT
ncbi:hypothetical protein [Mycolicibacterium poriferae]|jgi:hypothetical protein|uniref:hypothetical protein n=1 Tax=Mycolicibacterium poriferae TaxID=39694 RepID=UPI0024BB6E12|nr:hypothetical protein [Mycolicibacterium poriferae]